MATGRRPDELASDIVLDELLSAGPDPTLRKLGQEGRLYRMEAAGVPRMPPAPPRRHRGLNPANIALTDQLLAALDDEGPLPISTSALLGQLGLRGYQNTVLRLLNRLARLGEVEKIKLDDMRCCYWRRWVDGSVRAPQ